jgi:hypothetical protein
MYFRLTLKRCKHGRAFRVCMCSVNKLLVGCYAWQSMADKRTLTGYITSFFALKRKFEAQQILLNELEKPEKEDNISLRNRETCFCLQVFQTAEI